MVSLINVFSHLPDVHGFFAEIATLVRPGGELLVVTGNGADIERADYPQALSLPDHVVFGGEAHIVGVLERDMRLLFSLDLMFIATESTVVRAALQAEIGPFVLVGAYREHYRLGATTEAYIVDDLQLTLGYRMVF